VEISIIATRTVFLGICSKRILKIGCYSQKLWPKNKVAVFGTLRSIP